MIKVDNVSLKMKKDDILSDVSLHIKKGEAVGFEGSNGCGKTMLMRCICGFNTLYTGEIPGFIPYMEMDAGKIVKVMNINSSDKNCIKNNTWYNVS